MASSDPSRKLYTQQVIRVSGLMSAFRGLISGLNDAFHRPIKGLFPMVQIRTRVMAYPPVQRTRRYKQPLNKSDSDQIHVSVCSNRLVRIPGGTEHSVSGDTSAPIPPNVNTNLSASAVLMALVQPLSEPLIQPQPMPKPLPIPLPTPP